MGSRSEDKKSTHSVAFLMQTLSTAINARPLAMAALPMLQDTAAGILGPLDLGLSKAVLVLAGIAERLDERLVPKLTRFFFRAVARAAVEADATIVDGGTQAGVMALLGEGVASRWFQASLLGLAPKDLVTYPDGPAVGAPLGPNHSHFVLVEGNEWGAETKAMYQLVAVLAALGNLPVVVLLVGGGSVALTEMVGAVRQQRLIIVVEGSGGLADERAAAWPSRDTPPDNSQLAEILAEGRLTFYPLGEVKGLKRLLVRELGANQEMLQAWETFDDYEANANLQQKRFNYLQQAVILPGLLGTGLAMPTGLSLREQQQFLASWFYVGKDSKPIKADGIAGGNTAFALQQLAATVGTDRMKAWIITTTPGNFYLQKPLSEAGCAVLVPGQYRSVYQLGFHMSKPDHPALVQQGGKVRAYRDSDRDVFAEETKLIEEGFFGINIHRSSSMGATPRIVNWSAGCQVFQRKCDHNERLSLFENYRHSTSNAYSYSLLRERELVYGG